MIIPGGFGERGIEGKIAAAQFGARTRDSLPRDMPGITSNGDGVLSKPVGIVGSEQSRIRPDDSPPGGRFDGFTT